MSELDLQKILGEIETEAEKLRKENPEMDASSGGVETEDPSGNQDTLREAGPRLANLALAAEELQPGTRFLFFKKLILRLIRPFTQPQQEFNKAAARAVDQLVREQAQTVSLIQAFNQFLYEKDREAALRAFRRTADLAEDETIRRTSRQNARFLESGEMEGFSYARFQERFRGTEATVRRSLRKYLPRFEHQEPILDLGCGRGEFLELLRETGIDAAGVDSQPEAVELCHRKGLKVSRQDMLEYLEQVDKVSLGGIFSSQTIEHLPFEECLRLVRLAYAKLQPGGVLLLETPNPQSLYAHAHGFALDPTHERFYHPLFLEFLLQESGFRDVEVEFSSPPDLHQRLPRVTAPGLEELDQALAKLDDLVYGYQDFAVIGRK